jgi:regulator of sirC expression with transglutaminase-like and TPR domain
MRTKSRKRIGWAAGAIGIAVLALFALNASAQPTTGPESDAARGVEIARLIAQLDADNFDDRERATRELRALGIAALPALEDATSHRSLEVRWRARSLLESMTAGVRLREFTEFAMLPDDRLDDEHGMWLIARILDPAVKKAELVRQLDELAVKLRAGLSKDKPPSQADPQAVVAAVQKVLFEDAGFNGNKSDYGNPANSSLARVLETKKGLPILLSHVVVSVCRRLEIPIVGVPASGRYIVKYDGTKSPAGFPADDIYLNPFDSGKILSREERAELYPEHDPDVMVPPGTSRAVLIRMLANLISSLEERDEPEKLRQATELQELLKAHGAEAE